VAIDITSLSPADVASLVARMSALQGAVQADRSAARAAKKKCRISPVTGACMKCGVPNGQSECGDFPGAGMVARLDMRAPRTR
jgi:hypothetical protein